MSIDQGLPLPSRLYRYHDLEEGQIRLLKLYPALGPNTAFSGAIQCDLFHANLADAQSLKYEALSYAWGTKERNYRVQLRQSGSGLLVTHNLLTALKRLQLPDEPRVLWIDQLCIDQENVSEREQQVNQMRDIYRNAVRAVAWLGDSDLNTLLLKETYDRLHISPPDPYKSRGSQLFDYELLRRLFGFGVDGDRKAAARLEILERFLGSEWFCRAWVYQEAVVAPSVAMLWGDFLLSLDRIAGLVMAVYSITKTEIDGHWHRKLKATRGFGPLRTIFNDRAAYRLERLDFLSILWHGRKHLQATDKRDFVYSFLAFHGPTMKHLQRVSRQPAHNLATAPEQHILADYGISVKETFRQLARVMIWNSHSLDILQYVIPAKTSDSENLKLPSWVPDWSENRFTGGSPIVVPGARHRFRACGTKVHTPTDSGSSILKVQGHVISTVGTIIAHDFHHSYFGSSLRQIFDLDQLLPLIEKELPAGDADAKLRAARSRETAKVVLRTLLVAGAFALDERMPHSLDDLLDAYYHDDGRIPTEDTPVYRRQLYLRQTGEVASGKRVFLTSSQHFGLGYKTIREGDLVCILYGSKLPCVLRRVPTAPGHYKVVGLCYLDGWMFGGQNPQKWAWWDSKPQQFRLV